MGFLGSIGKGLKDTFAPLGNDEIKSFIPGIGDAMAQEKANKANLAESALNRAFQERMSSTAYQRGMEDMKKAGLNPMLAYAQGGASAPSGSQATIQSASKTGLGDFALKAITGVGGLKNSTTALEQQQTMNESSVQLNASQTAKNVADADRIRAETKALGKKESEGLLWSRFYKGINRILDSNSKTAKQRDRQDGPLIKVLGPASKKESDSMFPKIQNWLK